MQKNVNQKIHVHVKPFENPAARCDRDTCCLVIEPDLY